MAAIISRMDQRFNNPTTTRIAHFLDEIGIPINAGEVGGDAFLPGISLVKGGLRIEENMLLSPGDLLHEAGHLAVVPRDVRESLFGEVKVPNVNPAAIESAAISWSYAASVYLGLDLRVVFHKNGYHGRSESLLLGFRLGVFPGLHELISSGMTQLDSFPKMQSWLRD